MIQSIELDLMVLTTCFRLHRIKEVVMLNGIVLLDRKLKILVEWMLYVKKSRRLLGKFQDIH